MTTPVEETLQAYSELIQEGKVPWIGASNLSPERLLASLEASKTNGFPSNQTFQQAYNLYAREKFETEHEQICLTHKLGVINYFSLASSFLTGKYRNENDFGQSARVRGVKSYLNHRDFKILKALDAVADEYATTPAGVALAWLIARPSVTAPIAGATSLDQLTALTAAAELDP